MQDGVNSQRTGWFFAETHSIVANAQAKLGWFNVLEALYISLTRAGEAIERSQNAHGRLPVNAAHVRTRR